LRKLQLSRGDALKIALGGLVQGYFFAWIGHFFVEHNKPATFKVSVMGVWWYSSFPTFLLSYPPWFGE
jgi:hypothetical protein